jgi:hypothetical protein
MLAIHVKSTLAPRSTWCHRAWMPQACHLLHVAQIFPEIRSTGEQLARCATSRQGQGTELAPRPRRVDLSGDAPVLAQGDVAVNRARRRRDLEATCCCASRVAACMKVIARILTGCVVILVSTMPPDKLSNEAGTTTTLY